MPGHVRRHAPDGREPRRPRARADRGDDPVDDALREAGPLRAHPRAGRVERIAKGSGSPSKAVSELVQKFLFMKQMMGGLGQNMGMLGKIPGMKQLGDGQEPEEGRWPAAACPGCRAWADARHGHAGHGNARDGHAPAWECPASGMPGHGRRQPADSMTKMKPLSTTREEREEGAAQARARRPEKRAEVAELRHAR